MNPLPEDYTPETDYGPAVGALIPDFESRGALGPGVPVAANRAGLLAFDPLTDLGRPVVNPAMARACHAGLWLRNNYLDESHAISQELDTPEGSFWHAVMHRREPDPSNSKYWWRKVGPHPVFVPLRWHARTAHEHQMPRNHVADFFITQRAWDPAAFVDLCEKVRDTDTDEERLCHSVQDSEWALLFDWCYRAAVGA